MSTLLKTKKVRGLLTTLACLSSFAVTAQSGYYAELEDKYVETSNISQLNNTTQLTLEMDVYLDTLTTWTNLLGQQDTSASRVKLLMHNGEVFAVVANGANTFVKTVAQNGNSTLKAGQWHHVAMTYNASSTNKISIYIDGVKQSVTSCNSCTYPSITPTTTGDFNLVAKKFKGKVDNVRVWSTALTDATIDTWQGKAVNNSHPSFASLALDWDFQDKDTLTQVNASNTTAYNGTVYSSDSTVANLSYDRQFVTGYAPFYAIDTLDNQTNPALESTHLIYTHISADPTGQKGRYLSATNFVPMTPGSSLETSVNSDIAKVKSWAQGHDVEVIQTWGGNKASPALEQYSQDPVILDNVVKTIKAHLIEHNLTGIDINWEQHPSASSYEKFYKALRTELGSDYTIQATITAFHNSHQHLKETIKNYADTVQLMFYGGAVDTTENTQFSLSRIQSEVALWTSGTHALDKEKIIVGLPVFGVPNLSYAERPKPGAIIYRDVVDAEPNIPTDRDYHDYTNGHRYYFNSVDTVKNKTDWVKKHGLKGVMFWQLAQDVDAANNMSLLEAASGSLSIHP